MGLGLPRAASTPHAQSHGNVAAQRQGAGGRRSNNSTVYDSRPARNCTTRPAGLGQPRAASTPHAMVTRRRCCPTARCWWQGINRHGHRPARNCTTRQAATWTATRQPQHRTRGITRQRCCPTARCWWQGDRWSSYLTSAELYDPASGTWTCYGQPQHRTLCSHGDVAAQRPGAGGRGMITVALSYQRGTVRPGQWDLDCHRQPQHRPRKSHGDIAGQRQLLVAGG